MEEVQDRETKSRVVEGLKRESGSAQDSGGGRVCGKQGHAATRYHRPGKTRGNEMNLEIFCSYSRI